MREWHNGAVRAYAAARRDAEQVKAGSDPAALSRARVHELAIARALDLATADLDALLIERNHVRKVARASQQAVVRQEIEQRNVRRAAEPDAAATRNAETAVRRDHRSATETFRAAAVSATASVFGHVGRRGRGA